VKASTFAGGTVIVVSADDFQEEIAGAFEQADGKVVMFGVGTTNSSVSSVQVVRVMPNGVLDTSFGNGGVTTFGATSDSLGVSAIQDRAGRIVVARTVASLTADAAVSRLNVDGTFDTTFGINGDAAIVDSSCASSQVNAIAVDSAGRILFSGQCTTSSENISLWVGRLRGDTGSLDSTFGASGTLIDSFASGSTSDYAVDIKLGAGGRPVLGGVSYANSAVQASGVARLTYDLIFTDNLETTPAGCSPPSCDR
jgi:uncharacterized delta-60 repeat protein